MWLEGMQGERNRQTDATWRGAQLHLLTLPKQRVSLQKLASAPAWVGAGTGTHLLEPIEVVGVAAEPQPTG